MPGWWTGTAEDWCTHDIEYRKLLARTRRAGAKLRRSRPSETRGRFYMMPNAAVSLTTSPRHERGRAGDEWAAYMSVKPAAFILGSGALLDSLSTVGAVVIAIESAAATQDLVADLLNRGEGARWFARHTERKDTHG